MKREAEQLRVKVRELVDELGGELQKGEERGGTGVSNMSNRFLVTNYRGRVASLRLFVRSPGSEVAQPLNIAPSEACELAAWILLAAVCGEELTMQQARHIFEHTYAEAVKR